MATLGALIVEANDRSETLIHLEAGMFSDPRNRNIFAAARDMILNGQTLDLVTLKNELLVRNLLDASGGVDHLMTICGTCPVVEDGASYAKRLAATTLRRRVIHALLQTAGELESGEIQELDAAMVYDRISKAAGLSESERTLFWMRELLAGFDPETHKSGAQAQGKIDTELHDLDRAVALFKASTFTVVAARPAVGKSSLMRQLAVAAASAGPIVLFSLEESKEQVRDKMLCTLAKVDYAAWYSGRSAADEDMRLLTAAEHLAELPIAIYGGYACDAARIRLVLRMLSEKGERPAVVFVDHLQLMHHPRGENRDQAVGETTRQLRLTALETGIPIVLLCQMNRAIDQRGKDDRRPKLSDLRESGSIEANAVNVLFLWRQYDDEAQKHLVTVTLAKHRDGPTAEFDLVFLKGFGRFASAVSSVGY